MNTSDRTCPSCGIQLPEGAAFCHACGVPSPTTPVASGEEVQLAEATAEALAALEEKLREALRCQPAASRTSLVQ